MKSERIYFRQGNVAVTSSRLVLGQSSYPLSLITAARVRTTGRDEGPRAKGWMLVVDLLLLLIVLGLYLEMGSGSIDVVVIGLLAAIPVTILGYAVLRRAGMAYVAMVTTPAGEQEVLRSFVPYTPRALVAAIRRAAADRGQVLGERDGDEEA